MGFDWKADKVPAGGKSNACMIHSIVWAVCLVLAICFSFGIFSLVYAIFAVAFVMKLRAYMRERYAIQDNGSSLCDCCLSFWCGCCTVHQMETHVNDYSKVSTE